MDGILRCSRYSFGPNRLHYCGPDANSEIKAYIDAEAKDPGLEHLLKQFETLYPYIRYIAQTNRIKDPFDERVVEAYWLGNDLLETGDKKSFYEHLVSDHKAKKKMTSRGFSYLENKIRQGAVPHHSFHVLNIWKRRDSGAEGQSVESMDECRIGWGEVKTVQGPAVTVLTEPLLYEKGKLFLGQPILKKITRRLEAEYDIEQIVPGNFVSIHWSVPCEVINQTQLANLKKYTLKNIYFANQNL